MSDGFDELVQQRPGLLFCQTQCGQSLQLNRRALIEPDAHQPQAFEGLARFQRHQLSGDPFVHSLGDLDVAHIRGEVAGFGGLLPCQDRQIPDGDLT